MTEAGLAILLIGFLIVGSQGVMLLEVGQTFLARVYPEPGRAKTVATLLVAPAFLLTCGALLLFSIVGVDPEDGLQLVLTRVGLIFFACAGMHLIALVLLARDREDVEHIEDTEERLGGGSR